MIVWDDVVSCSANSGVFVLEVIVSWSGKLFCHFWEDIVSLSKKIYCVIFWEDMVLLSEDMV